MKIALVAPSPIPFGIGGAEKLWWGLQNHINKFTRHQCELIKIPTKEHTFWDLIDSYSKFYRLDLSYFDMVISGKYPAWMVRHPNHHIYMLHCLRGLYDTYRFMNLPFDFALSHPKIDRILEEIEGSRGNLEDLFKLIFELREDPTVPREVFVFPGPFIRKIVHYLDQGAMAYVKTFSAISKTVANRKEYYPEGTPVKVIYPPSNLDYFKTGSYDYFFTVSRLDGPKRIRMIVEAYLKAKTDIPLKIAGTGPLENELREMAKGDKRIEFLGFVSDEDLIDYYADAFAVIFVPYDEDLGFITIEAMMSEKPVISFTDSGGVTEFVENGETGFLCCPDILELKNIVESVSQDKEKIIKMGKNAKRKVDFITWEYTVDELLNETREHSFVKNHQIKLTAVSTFPIYPPRGGGQNGIYYRYKELGKTLKVEIVSLANANEKPLQQEIAPNVWEIRIPKSGIHEKKEWDIQQKVGIPLTDIGLLFLYEETSEFVNAVKHSISDSDYVVCCHPYSYPLVRKYAGNKKIVYESHNMEYLLKKQMLPENGSAQKLLEKLYDVEKQACSEAVLVTVVSSEDAKSFHQLYGLDMNKVMEVPSCADLDTIVFTPPEERYKNKRELGLAHSRIALFIGSWHQPNIEAVEKIFEMAVKLPQVNFLIMGSVGLYFKDQTAPKNVGFLGVVDDEEKDLILRIVDVALNPMLSGSGINLKLLDYLAAGIPVITTQFGIRGLNIPYGLADVCDLNEFPNRIYQNIDENKIRMARKFVEEKFSWKEVCKKLECFYRNHLGH